MKTLLFTVLLFTVCCCCCVALPAALQSSAPESCCFNLSTHPCPRKLVTEITRTHSACLEKAFIVKTKRRQICYSQSFPWAQDVYKQLHSTEGSGQQL